MNKVLPWLAGIALVVAAGVVTAITPGDEVLTAAFPVHGGEGERIVSRTLIVETESVVFADEVSVGDDWSAEGNWLVVTLAVAAPQTEIDSDLLLAKLVIGDREFLASERPSTSLEGEDLRVGLDTVGMLAFELPADLDAASAELRLSPPYATPRLDDVVAVRLDLDGASRESSIDIVAPSIAGAS